ncbi:MAG: hypothetical protein KUG83_10715 [Gammaproteobacteria bacterium]|nr:hypothetical protein [Gammaproteobacteria bacterium]
MKSINTRKALLATLGTAMVSGAVMSTNLHAETNPFGMTELSSGYMQVAEGKCGEGKCGEGMKKAKKEGSCGEGKKMKEGACGEGKKMKEGSCGEGKKMKEGSCGGKGMKEGSCGGKS